jgi:hypothetical protein
VKKGREKSLPYFLAQTTNVPGDRIELVYEIGNWIAYSSNGQDCEVVEL